MTRTNRFNAFKKVDSTHNSVSWGKNSNTNNNEAKAGALLFAGLLIACSLTVGCSIDRPKPVSKSTPMSQPESTSTITMSTPPAPAPEAPKPAPKKIVKKRPATVTYTDKTYGVTFDYPRRFAIETGDAVKEVTVASPVPMNFVQPGGVSLAAVELPETGYTNTDFSSAHFNVSVNKNLTADQCSEFSVPQSVRPEPKPATEAASNSGDAKSTEAKSSDSTSKLMLGDLEMQSTEAVSGEGTRQSDAKYFHVFQGGTCYEFAMNVTTNANNNAPGMKHVDRDKVFARLNTILSTVKIAQPVTVPDVVAEKPATENPAATSTPATQEVPAENKATAPAESQPASTSAQPSTSSDNQAAPAASSEPTQQAASSSTPVQDHPQQ